MQDSPEETDRLRDACAQVLASGIVTAWRNRAYTSEAVNMVTGHLRRMSPQQLPAKLAFAGFTLEPYVSDEDGEEFVQACQTCMYYELHRQFCALPELMMPVKPEWSCRLWRI